MSSWSKQMRMTYGGIALLFIAVVIIVPAYLILYTPPNCTDGVKNGSEQGVDCGGSCERLCQSSFLPASVTWTRFEEVAPSLYNFAAYIVNPNIEGEAVKAPYHFMVYDSEGVLIVEERGTTTIPPHRTSIAFAGAVDVGKRIPAKALFEFTAAPDWRKRTDPLSALTIKDQKYTEDSTGGSLMVTLSNPSLAPIGRMTVYAILYDASKNALGFSKTVIDGIAPKSEEVAPFTWPRSRDGRVVSIEVLPVAE